MIRGIDGISGLPALLSELIAAVNFGAIEYSGREGDANMLIGWLAKGDHSMAEHSAKQMIKLQRNIKGRNP